MRGRACWGAGLLVAVFHCASGEIRKPTPEHPLIGCAISCPNGERPTFSRQHLCRVHSKRYFQDIAIIGEYGEAWITTTKELVLKADVEFGTCHSVIAGIIQSRSTSERGVHPGEENIPPEDRHR